MILAAIVAALFAGFEYRSLRREGQCAFRTYAALLGAACIVWIIVGIGR